MHQVDLVRVLVFAAVIGVHTLSKTNGDYSVSAGALQMVLHFTREAFFALSGFVLVYGQRRLLDPENQAKVARSFLHRRVRLVMIPYLAWTFIYWLVNQILHPASSLLAARQLAYDVGTGGACYHLYFLLVTLQIYLTFPVLVWLLRKTRGHHVALVVATLAFETGLTFWLHYIWQPGGTAGAFIAHADTLLPSYFIWVIGGGVAAVHRDRFDAWISRHARFVSVAFTAALGLALASYLIEIHNGATPVHASDVLQPVMLVWSAAAIVGLYLLGLRWAQRPRRILGPQVALASLASFGVFLVHPLVLQLITTHGLGPDDRVMPKGLATVLAYALTVLGASVLVAIFLHSPLSITLTGRPRLGTSAKHRRFQVFSLARLAGVIAIVVFSASVVSLNRANQTKHAESAAADEFTSVPSLVTTSRTTPALASKKPTGPAVQTMVNIMSGGMQRSYLLVTPDGPTKGLPLLMFLHGVTTSPVEELNRDGFLPLATNGSAVLVYPAGYHASWDASGATFTAAEKAHIDDVSFLTRVVKDVEAKEQTDVKRAYLAGYSNGGKMMWDMACGAASPFAAFAEFGANPEPCAHRSTAPIFFGVGGKDTEEPIAGMSPDFRGSHPAARPALALILKANGCSGSGVTKTISTVTYTSWTHCTHGSVTYADWTTEDHHWPRPPTVSAAGSAATLMWNFLSAARQR